MNFSHFHVGILALLAQAQTADSENIIFESLRPSRILGAALVFVTVYLLVRLSNASLEALGRQAPRSRFFFKLIATIIRFVLWFGAGFLVISIFSPSQETLIAVLGAVGIALGLGAQDLVKNIIGGIVILVDRPFQLGDRVKINDAYGEIDHIGLRSTKLTNPDDTRVTIPNAEILNGLAWNANSGALDCQVVTELYLPHDSDPNTVVEVCTESAYSSPFVLLSKPVAIRLQDGFQHQPYLVVKVKAYVYDHRFEPAFQTDITLRAKTEFLRRGMLSWSSRPSTANP